jgi:hypothetical protein
VKVLLDENLALRLRFCLSPHEVYTVNFLGWKGLKNGALLAHAEAAASQAFITVDKNLSYQQDHRVIQTGFRRS